MIRTLTALARRRTATPRTPALTLVALALLAVATLVACNSGSADLLDSAQQLARRASGGASPWGMFGKNQYRSGRSPHKGPTSSKLKWKFNTATMVRSEPAIGSDGTIYVCSEYDAKRYESTVYAINSNGSQKWAYKVGGGSQSPAIADDGTLYFTTWPAGQAKGSNSLFALNPNGSLKWSRLLHGNTSSSSKGTAVLNDNTVLVATSNSGDPTGKGHLFAFDQSGNQRWDVQLSGICHGREMAIGEDGTIYLGIGANGNSSNRTGLEAVNPDGSLKWVFETPLVCKSPSIGPDGTIYFGTSDPGPGGERLPGVLYALDSAGQLIWSHTLPGAARYNPAIAADGSVIISCGRQTSGDSLLVAVYAVNPDGSFRWTYNLSRDFAVVTMPAIDGNGSMFFQHSSGMLYSIDASGQFVWNTHTGTTYAEAAAIGEDGTVYVSGVLSGNGKGAGPCVFAFGPGTP